MLIYDLPKSLIECAANILSNKKTPTGYVSFRDMTPIESSKNYNYVNEELSGDVINDFLMKNENSNEATNQLTGPSHQHTDDDKTHVYRYSSASRPFNKFLYDSHKSEQKSPKEFKVFGFHNFTHDIQGLDAATHRNQLEHPLTTFSGIGWHPHERMDDDGIIHLPTFSSTTTSKSVAYQFAKSNTLAENNPLHILRIKNNVGDRGFYTKDDPVITMYEGEKEYIIPRNTKIKVNKTPSTYVDKSSGKPVHVWDAERIHTEPADVNYKAPHGNTELFNKDGLKLYQTDTLSALKEHYPQFHKIDYGSSFHAQHVRHPVLHLHTPDGRIYQSHVEDGFDGPEMKFLPHRPDGKHLTSDFVVNKYPQLEKFRGLLFPEKHDDDYDD